MDIQYLFRARSRARNRGFTLVELMIVVAIIGILAAMAVVGYSKFMRSAKTAEAKGALGSMAKGNISEYNRESGGTAVLAAGASAGFANNICDSEPSPNAVPAGGVSIVKGAKWQSAAANWNVGATVDATHPHGFGFSCLKFSMDTPQFYVYSHTAAGYATQTSTFTEQAQGDLNGDGNPSTFTYNGAVQSGRVVLAPTIQELNPDELRFGLTTRFVDDSRSAVSGCFALIA